MWSKNLKNFMLIQVLKKGTKNQLSKLLIIFGVTVNNYFQYEPNLFSGQLSKKNTQSLAQFLFEKAVPVNQFLNKAVFSRLITISSGVLRVSFTNNLLLK